jgi:alcohol dehydrogenase
LRALVFDGALKVEEQHKEPQIGPGEALIEVRRAGICNTDLEITRGYLNFHGVLGHEFVGVVREVASQEDKTWLNKRVVGEINAACGRCATCRANRPTHCPNRTTIGIDRHDGAFAEFVRLPVVNLVEVPASIPDERAVFAEPLAASVQILEQLHIKPTDRTLVIGDGKMGLLICQVLRLTGAEVTLMGRHPEKGALVERQGVLFRTSIEPEKGGFDVVVECTGNSEGLKTAKSLIRPRGTLILKSTYHGQTTIPLSDFVVDEINIVGSRCGPFEPAIRLLERRLINVDQFISAEFSLKDGVAAFDAAFGKGNIKVQLRVNS